MNVQMCQGLILLSMLLGAPAVCATDMCQEEPTAEQKKRIDIRADLRIRGDYVSNQGLSDFGFLPATTDKQIVSRTRLSLSQETSHWMKTFVQGQFYGRENREDYNQAAVYQAFVEFADEAAFPFALKLGRQELRYGSAFFGRQ